MGPYTFRTNPWTHLPHLLDCVRKLCRGLWKRSGQRTTKDRTVHVHSKRLQQRNFFIAAVGLGYKSVFWTWVRDPITSLKAFTAQRRTAKSCWGEPSLTTLHCKTPRQTMSANQKLRLTCGEVTFKIEWRWHADCSWIRSWGLQALMLLQPLSVSQWHDRHKEFWW